MANPKTNGNAGVAQLADISALSVADIEQLLKNKKQEQARVAAEKGAEARKGRALLSEDAWPDVSSNLDGWMVL